MFVFSVFFFFSFYEVNKYDLVRNSTHGTYTHTHPDTKQRFAPSL